VQHSSSWRNHVDVADALEAVVAPPLVSSPGADQLRCRFLGLTEMRDAEFLGEHLRAGLYPATIMLAPHARPLHDVSADAAQAEYHDVRPRLHLGGGLITAPMPVVTPQPM